ncbi:uncharacterized protein N7511_002630 [Penicillium nucicola]|uniref:uncharacterized protein n=1 Tax=Penicillium nucicola TaxID=1850975 RepID=UPI0025459D2F|nr:uncharacterized protein N7511_002630 [Penicillium nucicola]KAJ5770579.1 hypothetical protein N7511_002630 [Penicillium nucicola]
MSANEMTAKPEAEQAENIGTRVAKSLSKRLSLGGGSKGGASHGDGHDTILDKSASIRDEMSHGNFNGAKEIITGGQTKGSMSQGDTGGASSSTGANKPDMNKENAKETGQQINKGISQDQSDQALMSESSKDQRNTTGTPVIRLRKESAPKDKPETESPQVSDQKEQHQSHSDRRGSVAAGMLEPNYDIRKGPITEKGTFQEKNFHNKTGRETIMKRDEGITSKSLTEADTGTQAQKGKTIGFSSDQQGSSTAGTAESNKGKGKSSTDQQGFSQADTAESSNDRGKSSTPKRNSSQFASAAAPSKATDSSSQLKTRGANAENDFSEDYIQNELHDQENISGDVFDDGTGGKGLSKKSGEQDMAKKSLANQKALGPQGSKKSQQPGAGEDVEAIAAAAIGGGGMSKATSNKTSATEDKSLANQKTLGPQGSKTSQQPGGDEDFAAMAAAAIGGGGMSKATSSKSSTAKEQSSKSYSTSGINQMPRKDLANPNTLASTSPKSQLQPTVSAFDSTSSKKMESESHAKKSTSGAILGQSTGQGFSSAIPTESAYPSTGGMSRASDMGQTSNMGPISGIDQTSGLRSTTTSQTNKSMFSDNGQTTQAAMVGGGRLQKTGAYSETSKNAASTALGSGLGSGSTGTGSMNGAATKRTVRQLSSGGFKLTVLQEKVQAVSQKCKTQLGLSSDEISRRSPTVDSFFDAVASERLRWMPRDGSKLDCCLRWASRLAYAVDALRESVGAFAPAANEAAMLIWGFSILLLESDIDNTDVFESVFGRYGRVAVGIYLLLQYETAYKSSPELQPEVAAVFADLLEMVCSTTTSCVEGFKSKESDQVIGRNVDAAFVTYAKRYSTHWNCVVDSHTFKLVKNSSQIYSSPELGSLRQFLGVQDRPLQFILDSRSHVLAEGSFEWFNNSLYDFTVATTPVMLITGGAGSGKSAMAQWTVERLQESAEHDSWNVIPYTIRADIPVATLPLRILKGVLHQMLDHCVSDIPTQEAILVDVAKAAQGAIDGAGDDEVEESLWKGIRTGLSSNIQYMFVIDGIDQIKGGDADAMACLDHFCDILAKQNAGSKMIAFSRPLNATMGSRNVQKCTMQTSQTKTDLTAYVNKMLASGANFDTLKGNQLESAVGSIVKRSQGSFSWAEMAVAYAKQQKTMSQAVQSVQNLPQSMPELLDFHSASVDFSQQGTLNIVSWLAAAERPLLVEEIEQLLNVDPKGPRFLSSKPPESHDTLNALCPLVMTRDGVVSFAHTCIRDHVISQAKSSGSRSLNLREAHYDLLTRCLASVQLSVQEEVDISMDKLSMEERNHLFDKYAILEYTARYWLSHLLSSPLVTDDGEFQFDAGFKKLLPATVLFARLELTCRESQFTRSSVVELYRLASDIRRVVLGDKNMALLQSLLLSSRVAKFAHASHADEHCYEAWKLSQELLGQSYSVTLTCSEMMTQTFSEKGTMTTQQEDIMRYLILTDTEITGVEFNQRLKYLGIIVGLYKSRSDQNSALLISKHFYQQVLQKYGTNSRQSSETADFLTAQFSSTGSDEMSRDIARTKYDNVIRTMEVTDERRINYTLYMAQMYEQEGEFAHAQAVLSSLWAGLNSRDIDSVDMMDKKANVALLYYQFLRRHGRNDEAEVIMRELVADLEVTGVHSSEMMHRVHLLRTETQEMHLWGLDRTLSVLMWRYYKETNQEYSEDSTALALTIAQSMSNSVSTERASSLSVKDRKLLVELLDVISASSSNMTVTTLIMCHNLSSIYIYEEDWAQASECSMAVLQHIWPTVEQSKSYKKFSTELAPPAADLALILAYCHFRRLHLEQATTVYDNAFGSLISSDKVPVPSVLAVAKAVVEFYETSYQFTKALSLLHTVSNFLTARLGQSHTHTIDNMYLEAALATRLEMTGEAKSTYQRIHNVTSRDGKIAPEGIDAAIALIALYEGEMQWDSALSVYRSLWPTLVVEDNKKHTFDQILVDRMLEKTYLGYMSILTTRNVNGSDFNERYQVASDYVMTCRHVHGPTSQKTLNATLLFAELCESSDSHIDEAIRLYKQPLQTSEWVDESQSSKGLDQMTQPLPITLKHKLAQLYVRKHDSTSDARYLYTEEFQLAKKTQGYFSSTTLSWLRELAMAHSRQGTSTAVQQGNAILHTFVTDVLHAGGDPEQMSDWARKVASIYLECGFIEGGNSMLDELRHRVVYSSEASAMALYDRRDAVFVAGFEEAFGRRATYSQIMTEMTREMSTYQEFSKSLTGHDFIPTLITGHILYNLQTEQKRVRAAADTKDKLYEYFCSNLSVTNVSDKQIVQQFYQICLREIHNDNYNMRILTKTADSVRELCNSSRFQDATILTGVLQSFMHLTESLNNYNSIKAATQICLYLSGHKATKCTDEKTFLDMSVKSKLLLQEIMAASKSIGIDMVDLPFNDLNDIITLLGEYDMFDELEGILTQLWTSRIVQRTWTPDVVVWIGRRLVETRFCRGHVDSAIQLCRDICYNLRQVWGSCDPVTLEMTKLLSGLFTASENHQSAATLHEGILYDLLGDKEAKGHARAADTALQHMKLLRRAQGRMGIDKTSRRASAHADLFQQLGSRFGIESDQIQSIGNADGGEQFGMWSKPRRFSLDVEDLEEEGQVHHNHLRESSGAGLYGNGAPRRISVQAL